MVCGLCGISDDKLTPYEEGVSYCGSCNGIFRIKPKEFVSRVLNNLNALKMSMEATTIRLTDEQKRWIDVNCINLSKYLRNYLDEQMRL